MKVGQRVLSHQELRIVNFILVPAQRPLRGLDIALAHQSVKVRFLNGLTHPVHRCRGRFLVKEALRVLRRLLQLVTVVAVDLRPHLHDLLAGIVVLRDLLHYDTYFLVDFLHVPLLGWDAALT
jgi:hypothetical protein